MGTLWQDIKYGFRMLVRNPGFAAVVVLILAVGIGANTTMLSVVDTVMHQPVPYKNPDTLVHVGETDESRRYTNYTSYVGFRDWQEQNREKQSHAGISGLFPNAGRQADSGPNLSTGRGEIRWQSSCRLKS
jgi:hypothetical protein